MAKGTLTNFPTDGVDNKSQAEMLMPMPEEAHEAPHPKAGMTRRWGTLENRLWPHVDRGYGAARKP